MNLLGGCIGGLLRWLFNGVRGVLMWFIRQIISFLRFSFPHALRLVLSALWTAIKLEGLSIGALFKGFWPTVKELAEHWVEEALANGFPSIWERQLRTFFRFLAGVSIVTGWVAILFTGYFTLSLGFSLIFEK